MTTESLLQKSPLHDVHHRLGAQAIQFGGWELPVKFSGIVEEHNAVRQAAGVFDISHMGEIWVSGLHAADFLNHVLTNDINLLKPGEAQYSMLCNEGGGVVDDLYVYQLGAETFLLMVNAGRTGPDMIWLEEKLEGWRGKARVALSNESKEYGALAVQGPAVAGFIDDIFSGPGMIAVDRASELKKNEVDAFLFEKADAFVSRTGYTGEDGFEIIASVKVIEGIWERVLLAGGNSGIKPCGLGARDTLRLEVCYPLYGHELTEKITPIEAGLGWAVKFDKNEFIGREPMLTQKEKQPAKKLVAFTMTEKSAPPRAGYTVWGKDTVWNTDDRSMLGNVTSGSVSPVLGRGIGLAYVARAHSAVDTKVEINIRSSFAPAEIVKKPFYKKN